MITQQQLAWMAGIVDLKGRVYIKNNRSRKTGQYVMVVDSKNLVVVRRMCELTGTNSEGKETRPVSEILRHPCLEHCPEAHSHVYRDGLMMPFIGRWTITGASLVVVLRNLLPYLVTDREGYEDLLKEIEPQLTLVGQGSNAVLSGCLRLQRLGWSLPPVVEAVILNRIGALGTVIIEEGV
jgi:hypothetical protein